MDLLKEFWNSDALTELYFNNSNSLRRIIAALACIMFSFIVGKVLYWISSKTIKAFTSKTKNNLDDKMVDIVEKPLVHLATICGVWFGFGVLHLRDGLQTFVDNVFHILVAMYVGWLVNRLYTSFHEGVLEPWAQKTQNELDDQIMPVLRKGVSGSVWVIALIIGLKNAGYDVGALLAGLGIGGLAMAMAAKDTISNIFGGFTIFSDQPFKMNDRIKIAGYDGTVTEIGIRSTRLNTLDNREVTIPNAKFADAPVENVSREPHRKIKVDLGLNYDTTPEKMQLAQNILREIVEANENTEENIIISFNAFQESALNIMLIYYITKGADVAGTQNDINMKVLTRFNEEKLEFAFPSRTVYNA